MKYISTGSFCHFGLPRVNTGICVILDQQVCKSSVTEQVIKFSFHGFIGTFIRVFRYFPIKIISAMPEYVLA